MEKQEIILESFAFFFYDLSMSKQPKLATGMAKVASKH